MLQGQSIHKKAVGGDGWVRGDSVLEEEKCVGGINCQVLK